MRFSALDVVVFSLLDEIKYAVQENIVLVILLLIALLLLAVVLMNVLVIKKASKADCDKENSENNEGDLLK